MNLGLLITQTDIYIYDRLNIVRSFVEKANCSNVHRFCYTFIYATRST